MTLSCRLFVAFSLLSVVGCASEEAKLMNTLSGTYALTSRDDMAARMLEGTTMTLRPDGRWVGVHPPDTVFHSPASTDSGTYRITGPNVAIRSSEGVQTYVVRGDTLMWHTVEREARMAQTEAVTGVKMVGQVETFYVRQR